MTTAGDDIVGRAIEEVAIAISRYESDMLGRYMWEALDEQERGYYLDMARAVFTALPCLRAALAAAGPGWELRELLQFALPIVRAADYQNLAADIECALASQQAKPVPVANGEKK